MNTILPQLRPSRLLPSVMMIWGAVVVFMSLVQNYQGLWGLRFCLGIAEAAYYPGIIFLLGSWYTKEELAFRTALFVTGQQMSGAFSGLISGALAQTLDGANGLRGWRWLFIIEGLIAVVIAIPGFFLIPDYPNNTKWVTEEERQLALSRLEKQGKVVRYAIFDWVIFRNLFATPYFYLVAIAFSILQFIPQIINNFVIILKATGSSAAIANYMTVPVFTFAAFTLPLYGWSADRFKDRFWHCLIGALFSLLLYVLTVAPNGGNIPTPLLYVVVYLVAPMQGISPILMTWNNEIWAVDNETRAVAIALVNSIGNLVINFVNLKIWLPGDAPTYRLGKVTTVGVLVALVILIIIIGLLERNKILLPKPSRKALEAALDGEGSEITEQEDKVWVDEEQKQEKPEGDEEKQV